VFLDDNPAERKRVRDALPAVAVPELPEDPSEWIGVFQAAGYFEQASFSREDRLRAGFYKANAQRAAQLERIGNHDDYLRSLDMTLSIAPFDQAGRKRIAQLISKSNQFNLTTRRYTDEDVVAVMADPDAFGLQLRLTDRFGDNGIIAIVIGRKQSDQDLLIDTWLMSCRVLGRQVEPTTLNLIAQEAAKLGARRLVGDYIPTKKNAMVKDHYARLGFTVMETDDAGGNRNILDLAAFTPAETFIHVVEG
jgi:FkbH-like protein